LEKSRFQYALGLLKEVFAVTVPLWVRRLLAAFEAQEAGAGTVAHCAFSEKARKNASVLVIDWHHFLMDCITLGPN
jgi:hypothetical protein